MSLKHRKTYSHEFKVEAVKQSYESGKPVSQIARELDISIPQLYKWRERLIPKAETSPPRPSKGAEPNELEKLRRENARLKEERDILKKAVTFFANESVKDINSLKNTDESSRFD
jgi:transposase